MARRVAAPARRVGPVTSMTGVALLTVDELLAVSWCVARDVSCGSDAAPGDRRLVGPIAETDGRREVAWWCETARASPTGQRPCHDLARAVDRVGLPTIAAAYATERRMLLTAERRHHDTRQ